MKKFLAVVLSVLMIMSLAACGESSTSATAAATEAATTAAAETTTAYDCMISAICCEEGWIGLVLHSEEIIYRPTEWDYNWEVRQTLPVVVKDGEIVAINNEEVIFIEEYGPQSEYQGLEWRKEYERRCLRQDGLQ